METASGAISGAVDHGGVVSHEGHAACRDLVRKKAAATQRSTRGESDDDCTMRRASLSYQDGLVRVGSKMDRYPAE